MERRIKHMVGEIKKTRGLAVSFSYEFSKGRARKED